jgi:hypothetical protein
MYSGKIAVPPGGGGIVKILQDSSVKILSTTAPNLKKVNLIYLSTPVG